MIICQRPLETQQSIGTRAKWIRDRLAGIYGVYFHEDGTAREPLSDSRIPWWFAVSMMADEETAPLGNVLITNAGESPCHFAALSAASILARSEQRLNPKNRTKIEDFILRNLPGAETRDIRFHGYNDNFPAMATAFLAITGERLGIKSATERARSNLLDLKSLLSRRDYLSEYNSPTYTPVTLCALAEASNGIAHEETRQQAINCEQQVWKDVADHWHPGTCLPAGPYSRAYEYDLVGHLNHVHYLAWLLFGDRCFINPENSLFPPQDGQVIHHEGDLLFTLAECGWLCATYYHPPVDLEEKMWKRETPVQIRGTSEFGAFSDALKPHDLYGCNSSIHTTYHTKDYSAGSSLRSFLDGKQATPWFFTCKKTQQPQGQSDVRTAFCRYSVNNQAPGQRNASPFSREALLRDHVYDHGRSLALQHNRTALVAYAPKTVMLDYPVLRLGLQIALPIHFGGINRIWIGGEPVRKGSAQSQSPQSVSIWEGRTLLHIRPLCSTDWGCCRQTTLLEERNNYQLIHFFNFEHWSPRFFTQEELHATRNGFVAEIRDAHSEEEAEAVIADLDLSHLTDEFCSDRRTISYSNGETDLELSYSPRLSTIQYSLINGSPFD